MSTNIEDVLKQLDTLNIDNGIPVYVPSLQRAVKFKPLNLKQQKGLLKSSIDESLTKLSFNTFFYDIIRENILEEININQLYTFDRSAIAIELRAKSLDSKILIGDKEIDLNEKITQNSSITVSLEVNKMVIEDASIIVSLESPTLGIDRELNDYALNKSSALKDGDFKTAIGELFVYELVKFIRLVTIKSETGVNEIFLNTIKTQDKIALVEKLPSTVTSKILDFVKQYRTLEAKFTDINDTTLDISGSFFTV